jgi:hypothetical protein
LCEVPFVADKFVVSGPGLFELSNAGSAPYAVGGAKRQATVLQRAAQRAGWGSRFRLDVRASLGTFSAATFGVKRLFRLRRRYRTLRALNLIQVKNATNGATLRRFCRRPNKSELML